MMKVDRTVRVSRGAARALAAAGEELGLTLQRHASVAIEAAAALWAQDKATTAIPPIVSCALGERVEVQLTDRAVAILANIADERKVSAGMVMTTILERAAKHQPPPPTAYRQWRTATFIQEDKPVNVTGALMGDPGAASERVRRNETSKGIV